jgi:hypothetical protein
MPCEDVTEYVQLTLDAEERIESFSLRKHTCGATVGDASLLPHVRGLAADKLRDARLADLLGDPQRPRAAEAFLLEKQLVALQAALAVYRGEASGARHSLFAVAEIAASPQGTEISGLLRVDLATEQIRACQHCCGSRADIVTIPGTTPD